MYTLQEDLSKAKTSFINVGEHSTVCVITFINGFEVVGTYTCSKYELNDNTLRQNRAYENTIKNYHRIKNKNTI